jgi:hypothetical protein
MTAPSCPRWASQPSSILQPIAKFEFNHAATNVCVFVIQITNIFLLSSAVRTFFGAMSLTDVCLFYQTASNFENQLRFWISFNLLAVRLPLNYFHFIIKVSLQTIFNSFPQSSSISSGCALRVTYGGTVVSSHRCLITNHTAAAAATTTTHHLHKFKHSQTTSFLEISSNGLGRPWANGVGSPPSPSLLLSPAGSRRASPLYRLLARVKAITRLQNTISGSCFSLPLPPTHFTCFSVRFHSRFLATARSCSSTKFGICSCQTGPKRASPRLCLLFDRVTIQLTRPNRFTPASSGEFNLSVVLGLSHFMNSCTLPARPHARVFASSPAKHLLYIPTLSTLNIAICIGAIVYSIRMLNSVSEVLLDFSSLFCDVSFPHRYSPHVTSIGRSCLCVVQMMRCAAKTRVRSSKPSCNMMSFSSYVPLTAQCDSSKQPYNTMLKLVTLLTTHFSTIPTPKTI